MQPSPIADTSKSFPSVRLSMVPPAFVTGCLHLTEAGLLFGCPTLLIQVPADPLTERRTGLRSRAEPGSKSNEALDLLGSWTATLDEEEAHATHEEQHRDRSRSD
jgi:hypothetical protein